MALRMQTYIGLLCQDLVKRHELSPGLLLPPVLPLVFYNGAPRWSAPMDLTELLVVPPAELAALQPSQRYTLIDQQRLDRAALDANGDLLALLFRKDDLEHWFERSLDAPTLAAVFADDKTPGWNGFARTPASLVHWRKAW